MGEPAPDAIDEGTLLSGKYLLEQRLGSGGMGQVFRAQNTLIGRAFAIKVLRAEHRDNAEVVTRFLREARAANLVRHANVVDVLDVGQTEEGIPFIVQELLEGEDLAHRVTDLGGRIPLDVALRILLPVIDAVAFGHAKGVVHRDLKPENVYLARTEGKIVPKLLDYGISQIKGSPNDPRMTATGVAMGTPVYMSPEQVKGHPIDARTDVWALGVILHEVISGELPFPADSQGGLFVQICTAEPVRLLEVAPHLPAKLEAIILRCLRKAREERYADASEVGRDLRELWETTYGAAHASKSGKYAAVKPLRVDAANVLVTTDRLPKERAVTEVDPKAMETAAALVVPDFAVPDFAVPDLAMPPKPAASLPASAPKMAAAAPIKVDAPRSRPMAKPAASAEAIGATIEGIGFDDDEPSALSGLKLDAQVEYQPRFSRRDTSHTRERPESEPPPQASWSVRSLLIALGLFVAVGGAMAGIRYAYEALAVRAAIGSAVGDLKIEAGILLTGAVVFVLLGLIAVPKTYRSLRESPAVGLLLCVLIALLFFSALQVVLFAFE